MSQAYPFPQEAPPEPAPAAQTKEPNISEFLGLYRQTVRNVYRFQLIRTGEVEKGQALTAATFHAALLQFHNLPGDRSSRLVWLFRTALGVLNKSERGSRLSSRLAHPATDLAFEYPAQSDLSWRARIFNLAHGLNQLPSAQANALALQLFAGLSFAQTAQVLSRTPTTAARLVEQGLDRWLGSKTGSQDLAEEIVHTAQQTLPEGEFISTLEAELGAAKMPAAPTGFNTKLAMVRLPAPAFFALGLVLMLVIAAVRFPQLGGQAASLARNLLPAPTPALPSKPGTLIPPETAVCRDWQQTLSRALNRQVSLDQEAPFTDPMLDSPGANGTGCMLSATGTGLAFESLDSTLDLLSPLLEKSGFSFNGLFYDNTGSPDGTLSPGDWFGRARLWQQPGQRAILSVSWRPADQLTCPPDTSESACNLLPEQKIYTVRLSLAVAPGAVTSPREVALVADKGGTIYRAALGGAEGRLLYPLTGPGFYQPGLTDGSRRDWTGPRLSPDGAWLFLPQPDGSATWLLSLPNRLEEPGAARQISVGPLNGAWSPDSTRLAYVSHDDPQILFLLNASSGDASQLATLPGEVLNLAFSPDGSNIAAAYSSESQANHLVTPDAPLQINYVLINPDAGQGVGAVESIASVPGQASYSGPGSLAWTQDGSELWSLIDPTNPISISSPDGIVRPVVADPSGWLTPQRIADYVMRWRMPEISPDGQRVARLRRSNSEDGSRQVFVYRIGEDLTFESSYDINAAVLVWNRDNRSLVAASSLHNPGNLWWINLDQKPQLVSQDLSLIGLVSSLQRASTYRAVDSSNAALPVPEGAWQTVEADDLGISLSLPEGWHARLSTGNGEASLVLSNLDFARPGGWASLSADSLYVSIERYSMDLGTSERSRGYLLRNLNLWQPVMVGGQEGFRWVREMQGGEPMRVYVPVPGSGDYLVISKYPSASDQDAVFNQILREIKFLEPRQAVSP